MFVLPWEKFGIKIWLIGTLFRSRLLTVQHIAGSEYRSLPGELLSIKRSNSFGNSLAPQDEFASVCKYIRVGEAYYYLLK
jgi:hypothetical protein